MKLPNTVLKLEASYAYTLKVGFSSILALYQHRQMRSYHDGSLQPWTEHLDSPLGLVMNRGSFSIPPLLLHSIYIAAKVASLNPPERPKGCKSIFLNTLQRLNTRRRVADVYIESLETLDVLRL
ncbi:unnamed protein product [Clonostachys chloroleuca]|uniref:Uncharacterized protein n=1 Tax=Clonostachys chloroleuca TaxID=1926264 RepID=A0AA35Q2W0_9HYPO|nr:unnamed protein product [Clonostachys chloroleuca]